MTKNEIIDHIDAIISGSENEITADNIYITLTNDVHPGRTQESIRKYIREMVTSGKYLIGSSNKGYFKIRTKTQVQKAMSYLENRIPDLKKRANSIKKTWNDKHPNDTI